MSDSEAPGVSNADDDAPLDRTISPIAGRLTSGRGGKAVTFAGLLAGCAVFAFATWSADRPKPARRPEQPARQVVAFEAAQPPPTLDRPGPGAPSLTRGAGPVVPALQPEAADPSASGVTPQRPSGGAPKASPLMAYTRGSDPSSSGSAADAPVATALASDGPETELDQLRRPSRIGRATARALGDRNFLILAGTVIPCVLQTALDSSTPGYASCVLPQDVYSDDGTVVLMEKGSRVLGEYRGGLRQGQGRIFVLWTRAVTPAGVAIDLASPASDALGRGGFDGTLDAHFWDRFGAAVLLSVVDGATYGLADQDGANAATRLPSDAAAIAVQKGAEIGPTLRKAQGAEVSIFAARDFDFSQVYGLKARGP